MHETIQELLRNYGEWFYAIAFLWAFLEGETFLIFAGFAASKGFLTLWGLILAAGVGTTLGDFAFFLLGRYYGTKLIAKMPRLAKGQAKVMRWLEQNDVAFIIFYRFIYGLRNVSAITIGMTTISSQRYFVLNMIGAFVWAVSFACGGYMFGHLVVSEGENPITALMIGALLLFTIFIVIRYVIRRYTKQGTGEATPSSALQAHDTALLAEQAETQSKSKPE